MTEGSDGTGGTDGPDARAHRALLAIVNSLVDCPELLVMDAIATEYGVTFRVRAAHDDLGKLIGRQGRNARAIRDLMNEVGVRARRSYCLDIVQPQAAPALGSSA